MSSLTYRGHPSLALGLALVLAAAGCNCNGEQVKKKHCITDLDCNPDPANASKYCDQHIPALAEADETGCVQGEKECTNEGQCCPGQICSSTTTTCLDKYVKCADDTTCTVKGQICTTMGNAVDNPDKGCGFAVCGDPKDTTKPVCAPGLFCFNGYCVGEPPCNGGCASGSVCVTANNRCGLVDDPNTPYPASCTGDVSCKPGTILVYKDGLNVFRRCDHHNRDCACEALPPVRANDTARHSSAALTAVSILVSAYDGDHGDLVVHEFDKATRDLKKTEWVDGVPTTGAVIGDPDGPRGGRSAPGPDVGTFTSLAFDTASNITHVAYYAIRDGNTPLGNLKYASRSGTAAWKTHTVDGQSDAGADTGDVGLYASLALTGDGFPVIAYFMKGGVGNDAFKTGLKVARAKVRQPEKAADWTITLVEGGTRPPPPCASPACTADQVCTASEANPNGLCRTKSKPTDCKTPACGASQACAVNAAGAPACFDSLRASTLAALPEGNGLFPSIAYLDDKPVVVWYDHNKDVLKGAIAASDSASAGAQFQAADIKVLDDGVMPGALAGAPHHDMGQFTSLAVGPTDAGRRLAVSYFDATTRQLRVLTAKPAWAELTPPQARIVDDGKGSRPEEDPTLFVGADSNIKFDASKNLEVVYQDSTSNDLRLAVQQAGGNTFTLATIAQDGAGGFYPNLLIDGANRFATHAVIKAKSPSESANKLEILKIQLQ